VEHAREKHDLSERHACRLVNRWRGTQRYLPIQRVDEDAQTRDIITLASEYSRYGYRRITALLRMAGWQVGRDRHELRNSTGRILCDDLATFVNEVNSSHSE
jgi:putative transposase